MKFRTIYADCPWKFGNVRTGGSLKSGAASKYPVMTTADICRMDVPSICEDDAVLFLWVPVAMLPDGMRVVEAWGFKYRTALFWHKTGRLGLGYWFRNEMEILLLGVHGHITPFRSAVRNTQDLPVEEHSRKPMQFRQIIMSVIDGPWLEMFARPQLEDRTFTDDGWRYHGNQVPAHLDPIVVPARPACRFLD